MIMGLIQDGTETRFSTIEIITLLIKIGALSI
jgi:hypothetical protein